MPSPRAANNAPRRYLYPFQIPAMLRSAFGLFALCLLAQVANAQAPNTQLYVFDLTLSDTSVVLNKPLYLTDFNRDGYNNQPYWIDDNRLYASVQLPGQEQPDVYRFDLASRTREQMTATQAGEYSPKTQVAGGDRFTAVRQEYVGRDTVLRLWDFPADRSDNGRPVFTSLTGIGYYEWLNASQLALFLVENPSRLVLSAAGDGATPREIAPNTGRTFGRLANGNLVYVDKSTSDWQLQEKNLYRLEEPARTVGPMLEGSEDFVVLRDGSYLTGRGSRLYRLRANDAEGWRLVADLSNYGLQNITRLSVNRNGRLALVSEQ